MDIRHEDKNHISYYHFSLFLPHSIYKENKGRICVQDCVFWFQVYLFLLLSIWFLHTLHSRSYIRSIQVPSLRVNIFYFILSGYRVAGNDQISSSSYMRNTTPDFQPCFATWSKSWYKCNWIRYDSACFGQVSPMHSINVWWTWCFSYCNMCMCVCGNLSLS